MMNEINQYTMRMRPSHIKKITSNLKVSLHVTPVPVMLFSSNKVSVCPRNSSLISVCQICLVEAKSSLRLLGLPGEQSFINATTLSAKTRTIFWNKRVLKIAVQAGMRALRSRKGRVHETCNRAAPPSLIGSGDATLGSLSNYPSPHTW